MTITEIEPKTIHRAQADLPFVDLPDGSKLQLLQVDLAQGIWIIRTLFAPGMKVQTHKHTGHVYAFTQSGSWHYLESPDEVNRAGSYLFEPAGSVHTLYVPETNDEDTDVWFTIYGANLNLDEDGNVESIIDAHGLLPVYRAMCADQHGVSDPPVIVLGS